MNSTTTPEPDEFHAAPGSGPGAAAGSEFRAAAGPGFGELSSVGLAMLQDRQRAVRAEQALEEAGELQTWAVRFGLLGDENRLKILLVLHSVPGITVGDLAEAVGMSDNAASHALSALRMAGVVSADRDGRFRRWSLTDQEIHDILHAVGAGHADLHEAH